MTEITEMVDKLEMDLMAARKTGDVVAYLIPYGPDYTEGLALSETLLGRLKERGMVVNVDAARAENGLALVLEDTTPPRSRAA
jgi:hypothetical protein